MVHRCPKFSLDQPFSTCVAHHSFRLPPENGFFFVLCTTEQPNQTTRKKALSFCPDKSIMSRVKTKNLCKARHSNYIKINEFFFLLLFFCFLPNMLANVDWIILVTVHNDFRHTFRYEAKSKNGWARFWNVLANAQWWCTPRDEGKNKSSVVLLFESIELLLYFSFWYALSICVWDRCVCVWVWVLVCVCGGITLYRENFIFIYMLNCVYIICKCRIFETGENKVKLAWASRCYYCSCFYSFVSIML